MINNDLLRRLSVIFNLDDETIIDIFSLSQCEVSASDLAGYFKEKNDPEYVSLEDSPFASFLNGLIISQRGPSDGPIRAIEQELTNNMIFNKVKIALALKADEVIEILELAGVSLGKYELSAFFRNVNHKHYKNCSDEALSAFLKGLKIKMS